MAQAMYQPGQTGGMQTVDRQRPPGAGWTVFAGVMMVVGGSLNVIYGVIAIVNDEWEVWTNRGDLYLDISQWGWVHLVVGVVVLIAGFGVFTGHVLARMIGVVVAAVNLVANFFFIPAYPLWAITLIVIDTLVIWALTAHSWDTAEA